MQSKKQILFVVGETQFPGVCQNNHCVVESFGEIVNHEIIEHSCVPIFFLYQQIVSAYLVVENTFGNIQFRRFLSDREKQGIHFDLSFG